MVDLRRRRLPELRVDEAGFGEEVPVAARHQLAIVGSLVDHVATAPDVFVIRSFASPPADGFAWVSGDAAAEMVDYPPARDWLRQRHHPLRPWFSPGWFDGAVGYATGILARQGAHLSGEPVQVRHWPLSSVIRLRSTGGTFYLKTVPTSDVCEPCLLAVLRDQIVPHLPPAPLAHDHDHRRWVSSELPGTDGASVAEDHRLPAVRALAELQQATMPHVDRLEAFGIEQRPLESMPSIIAGVIGREDLWNARPATFERWRGLTGEQHCAWADSESWLVDCADRLAELASRTGVRTSLVHGDFHAGNTQVQADGRVVVHDWTEAVLAHPFMDLGCWIDQMTPLGAQLHVNAYLSAWSDLADPVDLVRMWRAAKPISGVMALHQAIRQCDEYGPTHRHAMIAVVYGWVRRILGAGSDRDVRVGNWPAA